MHLSQQMDAAQHWDGSGMCGQVVWSCFGSCSLLGRGALSQYGNGCRDKGKSVLLFASAVVAPSVAAGSVCLVFQGGVGLFCWVCVPRTHADSFHAGQKKWTPPLGRCP